MKILIAQSNISYLNIKANIARIESVIRKNLHLKPDLVIFPEYALTGPLFSNYHLAFDNPAFELKPVINLAKKYNVNIVPGSFVRRIGKKLFNSTCIIHSDGKISDFYDKHRLWSSERRFLISGCENPLFTVAGYKISLQICADLNYPLLSHEYRALNPDVIINIAMWAQEDRKIYVKNTPVNIERLQVETLMKARAVENRCYTVFCNFGGHLSIQTKTRRIYHEASIGNSMIVNPYGEIIAKVTTTNQETISCNINKSKCHWSKY